MLQVVILGLGILWLLFVAHGVEKGRHLLYMAVGWAFMAALYLLQGGFKFVVAIIAPSPEPLATAKDVVLVVDSTLSLLSSAALLMSWYLMRDLRLGTEHKVADTNPTMSKPFVAVLGTGLTASVSSFMLFVDKLIDNPALVYLYLCIDVTAAAIVGVLIGIELYRSQFLNVPSNSMVFGARSFRIARIFCLVTFVIWGLSQFPHILSRIAGPDHEFAKFFRYPSGIYYHFLGIMKLLCSFGAGLVGLHILPEKPRFRHHERYRIE